MQKLCLLFSPVIGEMFFAFLASAKNRGVMLLLLLLPLTGLSQVNVNPDTVATPTVFTDTTSYPLSTQLNESRMGMWQQGRYKIFVEMDPIEIHFRQTAKSYLLAVAQNGYSDSVALFYRQTAARYLAAADGLKNAENGFDLRTLVLYYGLDNEKQNTGNSYYLENEVKTCMESFNVMVFVNDTRIYSVKKLVVSNFEPGQSGYTISFYHDDVQDPIMVVGHFYGW